MNKNKQVVVTLSELLPDRRNEVTPGMLRKLRFVTGFTLVEIFRKRVPMLLLSPYTARIKQRVPAAIARQARICAPRVGD